VTQCVTTVSLQQHRPLLAGQPVVCSGEKVLHEVAAEHALAHRARQLVVAGFGLAEADMSAFWASGGRENARTRLSPSAA